LDWGLLILQLTMTRHKEKELICVTRFFMSPDDFTYVNKLNRG